jgi:LacI family transcriptional regulator
MHRVSWDRRALAFEEMTAARKMQMKMRVRIKDIAGALDLSVATVQKVLRDAPGFNDKTRKRVLKKAKELGYHPNWAARSLVTRKTHVIGVAVPNLVRPFFPAVLQGIDAVVYPEGYSLAVFNTDEDRVREDKGVAAFLGRQIDGLVIASAHKRTSTEVWEPIRQSKVPFVLIDRLFPRLPYVGADNEKVGVLAVQHLLEQRYRLIAAVVARCDLMPGFGRYRGYLRALRSAGMRVRKEYAITVEDSKITSGYSAALKLLRLPHPPDAIFASTDFLAMGVTQAARELGLRIPEDLGIIGVGDIPYSDHLSTPLSSINLHPIEQGRSAATILLDVIHGKPAGQKPFYIEPTLVVRMSSRRSDR